MNRLSRIRAVCVLLALLAVGATFLIERPNTPPFEVWNGHTRSVDAIAWSPDGRFVASGSFDQTVRLWDAESGRQLISFPGMSSTVTSLAFSSDSQLLAAGAHDNKLHMWEIPSGRAVTFPQAHKGYITGIAFSSDGKLLATGSHEKLVVLWDLAKRIPLKKLWGFRHWVGAVSFSPDSRILAIGDAECARLINVESRTEQARIQSSLVHWISFPPDGDTIALGSAYGKTQMYDVETLVLKADLGARAAASGVYRKDGKALATGGGDQLTVWDAHTGKQLKVIAGKSDAPWPRWLLKALPFLKPASPIHIRAITYSPDGTAIAAACPDGLIRVWRELPE